MHHQVSLLLHCTIASFRKWLLDEHVVIQLSVAPNRIDLLTTVDGLRFEQAWQKNWPWRLTAYRYSRSRKKIC
jgi:hypothetical protein